MLNNAPARFPLTDEHYLQTLPWQSLQPGVSVHYLYRIKPHGPAAALIHYTAGADVPRHRHMGYEHVYVLKGSQQDERGCYGPGDLVINPPGSEHRVCSPEGCLVLVVWERTVRFSNETKS